MYEYMLGLYEKAMPDDMPLTEKLLLTKELGYDYMELCVDLHPERAKRLDWTKQERYELVDFMRKNGLKFVTLSMSVLRRCPMGESDENVAEFMRTLEQGLELACDLGCRVILFNGYDTFNKPSTPETQARLHKHLPEAAALAARYGVMIGIENADQPYVDSIRKARSLVDAVDSPWMGIYADFANTSVTMEGDMDKTVADIHSGKGKIVAMHLKDAIPGDYRYAGYGKGMVDFGRTISACKELGLRIFTCELFLYADCTDYKAQAKYVHDLMRSYF